MSTSTTLGIKVPGIAAYEFLNCNVESFSSEVVLSDDGAIPVGTRFNVTLSGLLPVAQWSEIETVVGRGSSRMEYTRFPHSATPRVFDFSATESMIGGPFARVTATQILGSGMVLVRVEIHDQQAACALPVVSHTWTQRYALDARGHSTRTVQGVIKCNRGSGTSTAGLATPASWKTRLPWGDLFRRVFAVFTDPGHGWRRESQEYYYDPASTALGYVIVDKNTKSDLPDGCHVGDMDFSYERSLENVNLATLRFSCELDGPLSLRTISGTTGNRRLLDAAIQLSKTRINASWSNLIIQRMQVTERHMLTGYGIRFELDATCLPQAQAAGSTIAALAYMVGQEFTVTRTVPRLMDPYGPPVPYTAAGTDSRIWYMVPHWVSNLLSGMDNCDANATTPTLYHAAETDEFGSVSVAIVAPPTNTLDTDAGFDGKYGSSRSQGPQLVGGYIGVVAHNTSITSVKYDGGFVRLVPMVSSASELLLQTTRPRVRVTERTEISRVNQAPTKEMRPLPAGAFLVSDSWDVTFGRQDPQGQRLFTGVYTRTYELYDSGASNGFGWSGAVRTWAAPNGGLTPPISQLATEASQSTTSNVLALSPSTDVYSVPAQTFLA